MYSQSKVWVTHSLYPPSCAPTTYTLNTHTSSHWRWQALRWLSGFLWLRVYPFWQYWQWRPAVWWRHFWHTPPLRRPDCWNTSMLKRHLLEWPLHSQAGHRQSKINTDEHQRRKEFQGWRKYYQWVIQIQQFGFNMVSRKYQIREILA